MRIIHLVFVVVLFFSPREVFAEPQQSRKLKLGVIAPLSGPVAAWGLDVQHTLLFAQQQIAQPAIDIIFEDDHGLGKDAVTAAHKLIDIDKIDFAMVVCSESLLSTAPLFERSRIIVISPSATAAAISKAGDFIFRTFPHDGQSINVLHDFAKKHHQKLGMVTEQRGYSAEVRNTLQAYAAHGELPILNEDYTSDNTDIRSHLLRLKSHHIDGIFINANSENGFLENLRRTRELLGDIPVYGFYFPGNRAFLNIAGNLAEGIIFVEAPSPDDYFTEYGNELLEKFENRFGLLQSSPFVFGSTFEAYRLFTEGSGRLHSSGQTFPHPDLRSFLLKQTFHGIFGNYSFDQYGDIQGVRHSLRKIVRGKAIRF